MEYIWAPWRLEFIQMEKPKGCILCDKPKQNKDAENYIIYRGQLNFVMLNAYPYNPGHLMVAPYRHIDSIEGMTDDELHEHFEIVRRSTGILRDVYCPGGFNLGLNLGRVAGVGIADHIHTHIVPRWQGDSNFMPVIAETKVLPEALSLTYQKLLGKF